MNGINLTGLDYSAMVLYLLAVVVMGFYFSKDEKNSEDFLLGGRKIPFIAVGISCMMSMLSTYSLVMVPGEIFNNGLSMWVMNLAVPILQIPAFLIFIRFYFKLNSFTPFEYLEYRYDKHVRLLVAVLYTYSRAIYLAMVLFATSKVFEGGAGWPAWLTILVVGTIGVLYTVMGGMKAVVWTDVLQFLVLVGGLIVAVTVLCFKIDGGFWGAITYSFSNGHGVDRFAEPQFYLCNPYVRLSFWLILIGRFITPRTQAASDQITIQRLLSTSSYKNAFKAQLTSTCLNIPFTLVLWFLGFAIFTYYSQNPDPRVTSGDTAFFTFVATKLPAPVPGLIMAAMLAAVMSTLDSGINSLSAIWLKEYHEKYINKKMSDREQVRVSRISTTLFGVFAIGIGLVVACSSEWLGQSVVEAATIFHVFEVIVFPAFLFAVLSKRATSTLVWILAALLWGMKFGMLTWYTLSKRAGRVWSQTLELGFGGPINIYWIIIPLILSAGMFLIWLHVKKSTGSKKLFLLGLSIFPFGYSLATTLWYIFSNTTLAEKPLELSFQWVGFPVTIALFLIGFLGLRVSKIQPEEKYCGLTLGTMNEEIKKDNL
jgi:SSS family transporter